MNRWDVRNKDSRSVRYLLAKSGENKNLNNICSPPVGYEAHKSPRINAIKLYGRTAVPVLCAHVKPMKFHSLDGIIL